MGNELLAAAARIEITPSEADVMAGKVLLRGFGAVTARAIKSKLFARILLLEAGSAPHGHRQPRQRLCQRDRFLSL